MDSIYFGAEHEAFRDQLRRFVAEEVRPHADAWEAAGEIPREVFRRMGALGFLGVRYPEEYGGAAMDTFGRRARRGAGARRPLGLCRLDAGAHRHGLAASGPLRHARAKGALDARHRRRRGGHRHRRDRAGRGVGRGLRPHAGRAARQWLAAERRQDVHHQRGAGRSLLHRGAHRSGRQAVARALDLHRREGGARVQRGAKARQDGLALLGHGGAGLCRMSS